MKGGIAVSGLISAAFMFFSGGEVSAVMTFTALMAWSVCYHIDLKLRGPES